MQFGFTLKPEHSIERTVALTRQAEGAGFEYGWLFDSHVLWREPYPLLTLMAQATERMRLGTCVTNPATREPSVTASLAGGPRRALRRPDGPRDRARRLRPARPRQAADDDGDARGGDPRRSGSSSRGDPVEYEGTELQLPWTGNWTLPVWVAGYGPMALAMTGRIADGVILQLADPDLIRWFVGQVREAEAAAGGATGSVKVQAAAPAHVGDLELCRERTRWFPALVSNHVVDLVNKYPREELPEALTGYIRDRTGYDYLHHAEVGSTNAGFVGDEVTDRFCVLGSVDDHVAKLRELADAGVDQFNIYLMNGDEEEILEVYGREIIPAMRAEAQAARSASASLRRRRTMGPVHGTRDRIRLLDTGTPVREETACVDASPGRRNTWCAHHETARRFRRSHDAMRDRSAPARPPPSKAEGRRRLRRSCRRPILTLAVVFGSRPGRRSEPARPATSPAADISATGRSFADPPSDEPEEGSDAHADHERHDRHGRRLDRSRRARRRRDDRGDRGRPARRRA